MPYILLGIGIFVVGLSIILPEQSGIKEASNNRSKTDIDDKLEILMDELNESFHLAGTELDLRIAKLAKLQESVDQSIMKWQKAIQEAQTLDEKKQLPQKHKDVLALNKNGLNITEIAQRLNIGKGEVELILALYGAGEPK